MSVKNRILSIISIFALAIMLTLVGIWAVTDLDFTVGGDITYTAPVKYNLTVIIPNSQTTEVKVSINQDEFKNFQSIATYVSTAKYLIEDVVTISLQNNFSYGLAIDCLEGEFPITLLNANSTSSIIKLSSDTKLSIGQAF